MMHIVHREQPKRELLMGMCDTRVGVYLGYGMGEKLLAYMKLMELMELFGSAWLWLLSHG
jgi:hypothetical protein